MQRNQRVADTAREVLVRQAVAHTKRTGDTGDTLEDALERVLETEAGRQLRKLRDGPHGAKRASQWQQGLLRGRRRERVQGDWELFMLKEAEQRELEQRKDFQFV